MKSYNITILDSKSLDKIAFFQFMKDSADVLTKVGKTLKAEPIYATKSAAIVEQLASYEGDLHKSRAGQIATKLAEANQARDDAYSTLTSLVKAYAKVKETETAKSYELLSSLFKSYKNVTSTSYEKETESIEHLLKQLERETYQPAIVQLHLEPHVANLKTSQAAFMRLYQERLTETNSKAPSQIKTLRLNLQKDYELLLDLTAIKATAYPETTAYKDLLTQLNTIRTRYKTNKSKKTTKTETKEQQIAEQIVE